MTDDELRKLAADAHRGCEQGWDVIGITDAINITEELIAIRAALATAPKAEDMRRGAIGDIAAERQRQVDSEGWTLEHDDQHADGEMALAACCYAAPSLIYKKDGRANATIFADPWPWAEKWDKRLYDGNLVVANVDAPRDLRRRLLVMAGALITAEIERLDRDAAQ